MRLSCGLGLLVGYLESRADDEGVKRGHVQVGEFTEGVTHS